MADEPARPGLHHGLPFPVCSIVALALVLMVGASAPEAPAQPEGGTASWLVRAGTAFQRAGEYTIRLRNTRYQDALRAYGEPSSCRVAGSENHAVATWAQRGIWIDLWTYGLLPAGETGCSSPDLIHVSEIRLTDRRWTTSFGLQVGDPTTKLRRLYPRARYVDRRAGGGRAEYWLVQRRGPCIGDCTPREQKHGVAQPRLSAQVGGGRVIAFWVPVFGQGE